MLFSLRGKPFKQALAGFLGKVAPNTVMLINIKYCLQHHRLTARPDSPYQIMTPTPENWKPSLRGSLVCMCPIEYDKVAVHAKPVQVLIPSLEKKKVN